MFKRALFVVSVLALSLNARPSLAVVTTYDFTGQVTYVADPMVLIPPAVLSGIAVGDPIVGSFSYDAATSPSTNPFASSPQFGSATYYEIPNTFSLAINDASIPITTEKFHVFVWNDAPSLGDHDGIVITNMGMPTSYFFTVGVTNLPSDTFNDDSLPTTSINGILALEKYTSDDYLRGSAGMVASTSPVPIPPAIWLFGSGLVGLVGLRRRCRK